MNDQTAADTASTTLLSQTAGDNAAAADKAAAATTTTPAAWTWADETGKFSQGWLDKLPDGLGKESSLKTLNDLPTLARAYLDTKRMVGKKIAPPTEKSTPGEISAWRQIMGAPEKIEDYGDLKPKDLPAEMWNGELEKSARELAHKHHLPPAALKEFTDLQVKATQAAYEREVASAKQQLEAGQMQLRAEWGEHFERNRARALAVAAAIGIPESDDIFVTRPDLLTKLAQAAPTFLGGDKIISGAPIGIAGGLEAQRDAVRNSPEYLGQRGPQAQAAAQTRLHQIMRASQQAAKAA